MTHRTAVDDAEGSGRLAPPRVTVIGEALIDVLHRPGEEPVETPGGSPLNVAISLARLGVPTHLLTALGADDRATAIERHAIASAVHILPNARTLAATSCAVAWVDHDGAATYDFDIQWDLPPTELPRTEAVHTGSLALFISPGRDQVMDHLTRASQQHALVSIDPNIRPSILNDRNSVRARFWEALALADVVKLSDEDAAWLYPDRSPRWVLAELLQAGPALAAMTLGRRGAMLSSHVATVQVPAASVVVVDTVGAGDSFMGALIHGLLELRTDAGFGAYHELGPEELSRLGSFAALVAGRTVARNGANPPWIEELLP